MQQQPLGPASTGPGGVATTTQRDPLGRVLSRTREPWGGAPVEAAEVVEYRYNAAGWLTRETDDEHDWSLEHDRIGNVTRREDAWSQAGWSAAFGLENRLLSQSPLDGSGGITFSYDARGRREQDADGNELAFSPRGRVEQVLFQDGSASTFDYGIGGMRVREAAGGGERTFQYGVSGWLPWVTAEAAGDRNTWYRGDEPLVTLEPMGEVSSAVVESGTPWLVTSSDGSASRASRFDAWGAVQAQLGPPGSNWAGLLGNEVGVDLFSAGMRDYEPATGTWLQPDPLGVDGDISSYRYGEGDPVNKTDPSGLCVDYLAQAAPRLAQPGPNPMTALQNAAREAVTVPPPSFPEMDVINDQVGGSSGSWGPGGVVCPMCGDPITGFQPHLIFGSTDPDPEPGSTPGCALFPSFCGSPDAGQGAEPDDDWSGSLRGSNHSIRGLLGVDDSSLADSIDADPSMGNMLAQTAKETGYDVWNFLTAGFLGNHDALFEKHERGGLSDGEYLALTAGEAGKSAAIVGLSAATGGATTATTVGGRLVQGAVQGGVSGAATEGLTQGVDIALGQRDSLDLEAIEDSALVGAAFGLGGAVASEGIGAVAAAADDVKGALAQVDDAAGGLAVVDDVPGAVSLVEGVQRRVARLAVTHRMASQFR